MNAILNRRNLSTVFWSALLLLAFVFLLGVLARPDPDGRLIWARAQRLEASNLIRPALRQYELLADTYPNSPYALRALQREAGILSDLAQGGQTARYRDALEIYQRLANDYPQSAVASDALLEIGEIQRAHLKNLTVARQTYQRLMNEYPRQRDVVSQAMIALGRVAQAARDGKSAQRWFQKTLQTFPEQPDRCGEAQFRLGETYETLWRKKDWARNAYDTTIQKYPDSVWAARARENLGLLVYGEMVPSARRVLVRTTGAFTGGAQTSPDALLNALSVVLGARGVNADAGVLRGWSLQPFVAAFDLKNPSSLAAPQMNAFENAVAVAGMTYNVSDGGDLNSARRNLQNEIDTGHLVLIYNGEWQLVAGYDSSENLIFLQSGARVQPVSVASFLKNWSIRSPLGGSYTLIAFSSGADDLQAKENLSQLPVDRILAARRKEKTTSSTRTKTSAKNASAKKSSTEKPVSIGDELPNILATVAHPIPIGTQISRAPRGLLAPTWVFSPPVLDEKSAYRRALRRAALWMRRPRSSENVLLNIEALRALSDEMTRLSVAPAPKPAPTTPEAEPLARNNAVANATDDPANDYINAVADEVANGATASPSSTRSPTAAPANAAPANASPAPKIVVPMPDGKTAILRVRALISWRNAPLTQWLEARRDASAFLTVASSRLNNAALKDAAKSFQSSMTHLQNARNLMNNLAALNSSNALSEDASSTRLSERARALLLQTARELEAARQQESRAADLMSQV